MPLFPENGHTTKDYLREMLFFPSQFLTVILIILMSISPLNNRCIELIIFYLQQRLKKRKARQEARRKTAGRTSKK